jgi:hypothetical protein
MGLVGVCGTRRPLREFDKARERSAAAITRSRQGASVRARVIEPSYRRRYLTIVNKEWRLAGTFPSTAMSEHERFSVPHEIDEILERLPPQVTLNVPDHILSRWFPPGPVNGVMEGATLARAQSYAQSCACRFAYHGSAREGVFYKPIPSDD